MPPDFLGEFDRVAALSPLKPGPAALSTALCIADDVSTKYFDPESHSPELMALGDTCPTGNPVQGRLLPLEVCLHRYETLLVSFHLRHSSFGSLVPATPSWSGQTI